MTGKIFANGIIRIGDMTPAQFEQLKAAHERATLAEPGCIAFTITKHAHVPEWYVVKEEFHDREAFEAHTARTRASDWWTATRHLERDIIVTETPNQAALEAWTAPAAPPDDLVLRGQRVRLERLSVATHAADLFDANSAAANWAYLPYGPFDHLSDYADWIGATCTGNDPHFMAVIDLATGKAVGIASYLRINPDAGSIEVGHINFSPLLQRTPAATEAMFLMMQWAFEAGYRRYEWKCNAANMPSRRAAIRLGLSYEGIFRNHMPVKGHNRDTAWFAAIDAEWPSLNRAFKRWLAAGNFDADGKQQDRLSVLTAPFLANMDPGQT